MVFEKLGDVYPVAQLQNMRRIVGGEGVLAELSDYDL